MVAVSLMLVRLGAFGTVGKFRFAMFVRVFFRARGGRFRVARRRQENQGQRKAHKNS